MLQYLPNEIILGIAFQITDSTSLINLALTYRTFGSFVYEVLLRNASIPTRSIPQYITHISYHPSWAHSVTSIELRDSGHGIDNFAYSRQDVAIANNLISKSWPEGKRIAIQKAFKIGHQSLLVWTPLLLAALPNAKSIRVAPTQEFSIPDAYRFFLRYWEYADEGFHTPLLDFAQCSIHVLTARAPPDIYDPMGFSHLKNLRTLIVDGECLRPQTLYSFTSHGQAMTARTGTEGSLPSSLQSLHVYGDEVTMPWTWLLELQWNQSRRSREEQAFKSLQVRLYFDIPCRVLARYLVYGFEPLTFQVVDVLWLFRIWEQDDADFQTLFRDPRGAQDGFGRPELFQRGVLYEEVSAAGAEAEKEGGWLTYQTDRERKGPVWREFLWSDEL